MSRIFCDVCGVYVPDQARKLAEHEGGRRHRKKLDEIEAEIAFVNKATEIPGKIVMLQTRMHYSKLGIKHKPWLDMIAGSYMNAFCRSGSFLDIDYEEVEALEAGLLFKERIANLELAILKHCILQKFASLQEMREYRFLFDPDFIKFTYFKEVQYTVCNRILQHVVPFLKH